jgi:GAG-pre-integrase domain
VVLFDISKVIFQEKRTGRLLGTDTWHNGLWYMDRDLLLLHHRCLGHPSFPVLSRLYPSLFEKTNKEKLVCDACELGKHTKSSYASSCNRSSCLFNLIHSDVWRPCPTIILNGVRCFISFIDCFSRVT